MISFEIQDNYMVLMQLYSQCIRGYWFLEPTNKNKGHHHHILIGYKEWNIGDLVWEYFSD